MTTHALDEDREYGTAQVRGFCTCGWRTRWCDTEALSDELVAEHVEYATGACVTYLMPGVATCLSDDHRMPCGWDRTAAEADGRTYTCHGCAPAPGFGGRLCKGCWHRVEHALTDWGNLCRHLGRESRALTPEVPVHVPPGPGVLIPALQLDIDEARRLDTSEGAPMVRWVSSDQGAMDAIRFAMVVTRISHTHPWQETHRQLPSARCPKCRMRALTWNPPDEAGAHAVIRCLKCGHLMNEDTYERYAAIEEQCCRACKTDLGCGDQGCRCHAVAAVPSWLRTAKPSNVVPADYTDPEHLELWLESPEGRRAVKAARREECA